MLGLQSPNPPEIIIKINQKRKKKCLAFRPGRGLISPTALFKKGPIGYKHSLPKANSPNKVVTASRTSPASPQGEDGPSPMVPLTGRLALPDPLGNGRPAPRWRCPGALAPDHPRTEGPRDSPSNGPHPWASNQRLVKGEMSGSPPTPREPFRPSFPLRGCHQGGSVRSLCTRRLMPVSGPSEDVHLHP